MQIAQGLYEGVELPGLGVEGPVGLITYMRTDSTRVSDDALTAVREHIGQTFGPEYVPEKANFFKTKSDAQDAHEAIRPTSMEYDPEKVRPFLTPEQYSIYRLIWNRFVASQMPPATFDETTVDIQAGDYLFRVKGTVPKFPGWQAAYGMQASAEDKPESEERERRRRQPVGRVASAGRRRQARAQGCSVRSRSSRSLRRASPKPRS